MMGLGWADIQRMSLWEYEARLWHWNEAHGGTDAVPPLDNETAQRLIDKANADPRLTGPAPSKKPAMAVA